MLTDEQFDKLPKYARQEIADLRREKKDLTERIEDILGTESSRIYVEHDYRGQHTQYLPDRGRVYFELPTGRVQVYFNDGGKSLSIMADNTVVALGQSSNVFRVTVLSREQEREIR